MKRFFFAVALCLPFVMQSQEQIETIKETINKDKIAGHIYFLADDLLQGREPGTPGGKIAASYIANQLRGYGVKPIPSTGEYFQPVPLQKVTPPTRVVLKINGIETKNKIVMDAGLIDQNMEAVYLGYGMESDFEGKDLYKKIVILRGGTPEGADVRAAYGARISKRDRARQAGALAVIELIKTDEGTWKYMSASFGGPQTKLGGKREKGAFMPYLWVQDEYGALNQEFENKGGRVNIKVSGAKYTTIMTQNVIGLIPGTDPTLKDEYIIYSAHYDHVGINASKTNDSIYNGARDNAVGTTTVLGMAEYLSKHPTKRSALFILFTAEEKGLLGSSYYVDHPVLPLDQMVFCFNSDNGGYNDTTLTTIVGLGRTTAQANIKQAAEVFGLSAIDDPAPEQGLFDRSDNVNFAKKGIPAPTYSMGFTAFDGEIMKYYHQPEDQADNLDYDYLERFFRSYVLSGVLIANDPNTPFWVKGDKYEAAGNALYKN